MDKLGLKMAASRIATNMEECMKVGGWLGGGWLGGAGSSCGRCAGGVEEFGRALGLLPRTRSQQPLLRASCR